MTRLALWAERKYDALMARARRAEAENTRLRGLLTLWLNVAPADVREIVLNDGKSLGEMTKAAFDEDRGTGMSLIARWEPLRLRWNTLAGWHIDGVSGLPDNAEWKGEPVEYVRADQLQGAVRERDVFARALSLATGSRSASSEHFIREAERQLANERERGAVSQSEPLSKP